MTTRISHEGKYPVPYNPYRRFMTQNVPLINFRMGKSA